MAQENDWHGAAMALRALAQLGADDAKLKQTQGRETIRQMMLAGPDDDWLRVAEQMERLVSCWAEVQLECLVLAAQAEAMVGEVADG